MIRLVICTWVLLNNILIQDKATSNYVIIALMTVADILLLHGALMPFVKGTWKSKLETIYQSDSKSAVFVLELFSVLFFTMFIFYPEYSSVNAVQVDKEFVQSIDRLDVITKDMGIKASEIPMVKHSYLVPKTQKALLLECAYTMDYLIEFGKQLSMLTDEEKEELELVMTDFMEETQQIIPRMQQELYRCYGSFVLFGIMKIFEMIVYIVTSETKKKD